MRNEKIHKNIVYSIVFTLIIGILSFVVNRVFSDQLGQQSLGLLKLFTQMLSYLNLAELGLGTVASSILYREFNNNNNEVVIDVISTIDRLYKIIAIFIILIGGLLNFTLKSISGLDDSAIYIFWSLYVLSTALSYMYGKYVVILTTTQKYGRVQFVKSMVKIILLITQIISLYIYASMFVFIALIVLSTMLEFIIHYRYNKINYNNLVGFKYKKNKEIITKTKQMFIHKIASVLVFNTDYLIIAKFINLNVVAIYASYMMITQFIMLFINNIVNVIRPKIGWEYARLSNVKVKELLLDLMAINYFIGSFLCITLYFSINKVLVFWMGEDYELNHLSVILIIMNLFVEIIRKSIEIIKDVSGYYKDIHLPITEGMLNLSLSLILVNFYGLNGVILGTFISNVLVIMIWKPYIVFVKILKANYYFYLLSIFKCVVFTVSIFTIVTIINSYIAGLFLINYLMAITTVSFFVSYFVYMLDSNFRDLNVKFYIKRVIGN